jgi:cation:H+ antiporter
MPETVLFTLAILTGLVLLTRSADRFVDGASGLALNLGVSPLIIGLTIVAFGTSAPEMLVSAMSAWNGNTELAIGNAIGSNIANIGLVLGLTALITPLAVHSHTLRRELPLMLSVMLISLLLLWDGDLSRLDGAVLFGGLVLLILWTVHIGRNPHPEDPLSKEFADEIAETTTPARSWWILISGLVLLLIAARLLVWGAVGVAESFGVSDLVIGLTVVAIGTSLPELAAAIAAARKGEHDIAVGTVLGSNLFNILGVLGIAGVIGPSGFAPAVLIRDLPLMIGLSVVLYFMARGISRSHLPTISRWEGGILLATFIAYQVWLYLHASSMMAG